MEDYGIRIAKKGFTVYDGAGSTLLNSSYPIVQAVRLCDSEKPDEIIHSLGSLHLDFKVFKHGLTFPPMFIVFDRMGGSDYAFEEIYVDENNLYVAIDSPSLIIAITQFPLNRNVEYPTDSSPTITSEFPAHSPDYGIKGFVPSTDDINTSDVNMLGITTRISSRIVVATVYHKPSQGSGVENTIGYSSTLPLLAYGFYKIPALNGVWGRSWYNDSGFIPIGMNFTITGNTYNYSLYLPPWFDEEDRSEGCIVLLRDPLVSPSKHTEVNV
jgi:hypothetical protein